MEKITVDVILLTTKFELLFEFKSFCIAFYQTKQFLFRMAKLIFLLKKKREKNNQQPFTELEKLDEIKK